MTSDADERRIEVGQVSESGTVGLRHSEAAGLHAMWAALRGDRPAPFRAELDAGRIGAKAPFLAIFEHVGPSNFRIRIAGDRLNRWFGLELRGMSALSMIAGPARNHIQAALNRVVADPALAVARGEARAADGRGAEFELVLLPMRSDFGRIDRVLAGLWLLDERASAPSPFLLDPTEIRVLNVAAEPTPATEFASPEGADEVGSPPAVDAGRPSLTSIAGEGSSRGLRRAHLRLVKND